MLTESCGRSFRRYVWGQRKTELLTDSCGQSFVRYGWELWPEFLKVPKPHHGSALYLHCVCPKLCSGPTCEQHVNVLQFVCTRDSCKQRTEGILQRDSSLTTVYSSVVNTIALHISSCICIHILYIRMDQSFGNRCLTWRMLRMCRDVVK